MRHRSAVHERLLREGGAAVVGVQVLTTFSDVFTLAAQVSQAASGAHPPPPPHTHNTHVHVPFSPPPLVAFDFILGCLFAL